MGALRHISPPLRRPCRCPVVVVRENNGQLVCGECAAALVITRLPNATNADDLTDALPEAQRC